MCCAQKHVKVCNPTWTILYKKEKTSETLAFFLDVATTDVMCVKNFSYKSWNPPAPPKKQQHNSRCWKVVLVEISCREQQGYSRGYCVWSTWNGLLHGPRLERVSPPLLCPSEESWSAQSLTCPHLPGNFGTPGPERNRWYLCNISVTVC